MKTSYSHQMFCINYRVATVPWVVMSQNGRDDESEQAITLAIKFISGERRRVQELERNRQSVHIMGVAVNGGFLFSIARIMM